ncbi:MAG: hypothetical protein R6V29_03985 [Spirochaetia bacterium]
MFPNEQSRSREYPLPRRTQEDLGLDLLAGELCDGALSRGRIDHALSHLPADGETVTYRRRVLADLAAAPELRNALEALLPKLRELTVFSRSAADTDSPLLQAIRRMGELELYVECIEDLCSAAHTAPSASRRSEGLTALFAYATEVRDTPHFAALKEELPRMKEGLKHKQSVTIGINLDERFRPSEAALLSVNPERFEQSGVLGKFLDSLSVSPRYRVSAPLHKMPSTPRVPEGKIPLTPLFQDLSDILKSLGRTLERSLKEFLSIETAELAGIEHELSFYLGAYRLKERLDEAGFATCLPTISEDNGRRLRAEGFYNVHLALRALQSPRSGRESAGVEGADGEDEEATTAAAAASVVENDIDLGPEAGLAVITGANQGGKTTFVQGAGIIQVMAQAGLFVTARSAELSPVDTVLTHFPSAEGGNIETGRLSTELSELSALFESATADSLLLLNESLAGTNAGEALELAEEMLWALRRVGTRTLYATHLHGIIERLPELNTSSISGPVISGLAAETQWDGETMKRTYRIIPQAQQGKSFARDLARRHGVTYEQLVEQFSKRGLL